MIEETVYLLNGKNICLAQEWLKANCKSKYSWDMGDRDDFLYKRTIQFDDPAEGTRFQEVWGKLVDVPSPETLATWEKVELRPKRTYRPWSSYAQWLEENVTGRWWLEKNKRIHYITFDDGSKCPQPPHMTFWFENPVEATHCILYWSDE